MGKLKKAVLGNPSGIVGQVLFRDRGGDVYMSTRPKSFMPGTDSLAVDRRNRFGITGKLAKAINSIDKLKIVWDEATPNNISPYNGIFKANYINVTPTDVSDTALMAPGFGFDAVATTVTVSDSEIEVVLSPLGADSGINLAVEKTILMAAVVFCKDTTDPNLKPNFCLAFKSGEQILNLSNPLTFNVALTSMEATYFDKYTTHKTFIAFVTLDENGKPVHYSSTIVE